VVKILLDFLGEVCVVGWGGRLVERHIKAERSTRKFQL
jgi:hypothetical protein